MKRDCLRNQALSCECGMLVAEMCVIWKSLKHFNSLQSAN